MTLWLAYTALAFGLMSLGAALIGSGLGSARRPAGMAVRVVIAAGSLVALGGAVAVALLEARAVKPW